MNTAKLIYPPLTQDNILILKGQPATKMIKPDNRKNVLHLEEWIYYNAKENNKESYVFKNGKLVNYNTKGII